MGGLPCMRSPKGYAGHGLVWAGMLRRGRGGQEEMIPVISIWMSMGTAGKFR